MYFIISHFLNFFITFNHTERQALPSLPPQNLTGNGPPSLPASPGLSANSQVPQALPNPGNAPAPLSATQSVGPVKFPDAG